MYYEGIPNIDEFEKITDNLKRKYTALYNKNVELTRQIFELSQLTHELSQELKSKDYSYSIDKNTFLSCLKALKNFSEYKHKLSELKLNIFERDEVGNLVTEFEHLISKCVNDKIGQKDYDSDLSYFIYDLNWGTRKDLVATDENGNKIDLSTEENLWQFFYLHNILNAEEKEENE